MRRIIYISIISISAAFFLLSCSKESVPAVQEEGEITLPMILAGGITPFDSPTKAPEEFTFSNENVIYLRLQNTKDENKPLIGRATYSNDQWKFTFQGSYENLTGGNAEAYLFAKNHSKEKSFLNINYRTPVYGTENGTFSIANDTLKVNAALKPVTGRVTFNKEENTNIRVCNFSGISYLSHFDIENFQFEYSSAPFDYGWMSYGDYLYGTMSNPEYPILDYYENYYYGCYFITYPPENFLQAGKSGYMQLPDRYAYNGWLYCPYSLSRYDNYDYIRFYFVGAGTYIMGNGEQVTITQPFFMLSQEVSQDMWQYAMEDNEYEYDNVAVTGKSFDQIQLFCEKLSQKWAGYSFRLPTEAEWELAARAGFSRFSNYRYSGSNETDNYVRLWTDETYDDDNPFVYRTRQRNSNLLEMYDMSGNAAELCSDWYDDSMTYHVVRGGSAFDYENKERLTVSHRCSEADYPADQIGFRLVVEANPFMFD